MSVTDKPITRHYEAIMAVQEPPYYGVTLSQRVNGAFAVTYEPPPSEERDVSFRDLFAHIRDVLARYEEEYYRRGLIPRPAVAMQPPADEP